MLFIPRSYTYRSECSQHTVGGSNPGALHVCQTGGFMYHYRWRHGEIGTR